MDNKIDLRPSMAALDPRRMELLTEWLRPSKASAAEVADGSLELAATTKVQMLTGEGKNLAVVQIRGLCIPRGSSYWMEVASMEVIGQQITAALASDAEIIVLDIDSPGGFVSGVPEVARIIRAARETKPVVACANHLAASAAYWLASAASEVVISPSGEVGSVGIILVHQDYSEYFEQAGIKTTIIKAGAHKGEGNPYQPLDDSAQASLQADVDYYYQMFLTDVASGRNVELSVVEAKFGQGRTMTATSAVRVGLADRVATFEETVARLRGRGRVRGQRAESASDDWRRRRTRLLENSGSIEP